MNERFDSPAARALLAVVVVVLAIVGAVALFGFGGMALMHGSMAGGC